MTRRCSFCDRPESQNPGPYDPSQLDDLHFGEPVCHSCAAEPLQAVLIERLEDHVGGVGMSELELRRVWSLLGADAGSWNHRALRIQLDNACPSQIVAYASENI